MLITIFFASKSEYPETGVLLYYLNLLLIKIYYFLWRHIWARGNVDEIEPFVTKARNISRYTEEKVIRW